MQRVKEPQSGGQTSSNAEPPPNGNTSGACFSLSTDVYADKDGDGYKFNTHVRVYSPEGGGDGHIQLFVNGNSKGWNQPWNKSVSNPFDIEPQYTDTPRLTSGSVSMNYRIKVDECNQKGNEHDITCQYGVANGKPWIKGDGCNCKTGNCVTPPAGNQTSSTAGGQQTSSAANNNAYCPDGGVRQGNACDYGRYDAGMNDNQNQCLIDSGHASGDENNNTCWSWNAGCYKTSYGKDSQNGDGSWGQCHFANANVCRRGDFKGGCAGVCNNECCTGGQRQMSGEEYDSRNKPGTGGNCFSTGTPGGNTSSSSKAGQGTSSSAKSSSSSVSSTTCKLSNGGTILRDRYSHCIKAMTTLARCSEGKEYAAEAACAAGLTCHYRANSLGGDTCLGGAPQSSTSSTSSSSASGCPAMPKPESRDCEYRLTAPCDAAESGYSMNVACPASTVSSPWCCKPQGTQSSSVPAGCVPATCADDAACNALSGGYHPRCLDNKYCCLPGVLGSSSSSAPLGEVDYEKRGTIKVIVNLKNKGLRNMQDEVSKFRAFIPGMAPGQLSGDTITFSQGDILRYYTQGGNTWTPEKADLIVRYEGRVDAGNGYKEILNMPGVVFRGDEFDKTINVDFDYSFMTKNVHVYIGNKQKCSLLEVKKDSIYRLNNTNITGVPGSNLPLTKGTHWEYTYTFDYFEEALRTIIVRDMKCTRADGYGIDILPEITAPINNDGVFYINIE